MMSSGKPACFASAATVSGLSPEMILGCTPAALKRCSVSFASARSSSLRLIKPIGCMPSGRRDSSP